MVYWDLTIMIQLDPVVLADIVSNRTDLFVSNGFNIDNVTYIGKYGKTHQLIVFQHVSAIR